jgi:hypothetical protein
VPRDYFLQRVIPLDHTVSVELEAGEYALEVRDRERTVTDSVRVSADAPRAAPVVQLEPAAGGPATGPDAARVYTRGFRAEVADGWIERVELREIAGGQTTPWRAPEAVQRDGAALQGTISVRQAPGDPARRIEIRAVDGQGAVSPPVEIALPAR